ncbi:MAG TPA: LssY C-terminal domain-containing protein [Candidatus Saccharimonadales bacterium]|nr:LssY C-terminal domain-containing protein [Candidatus Saccharimonadales bacterium]
MIQYLWLLAKRLAVLLPGAVVAYFSVRAVFPFVDHKLRLGDAFSIFLTYVIAAYLLIPALIRAIRILWPPSHLPLYCVTPDGFASDPLNIGIMATRRELINAMEKAGWHVADPHRGHYLIRSILSTVYGWSYPNSPVSSLYLFGRRQDIAFEIPIESEVGSRHHVRFWATTFKDNRRLTVRSIHWHHRKGHIQTADNLLWVGAASRDVGINFIRHNLQITHMVDPDTNAERELIVGHLRDHRLVNKVETITLGNPYRLINRVWQGSLHTDGKMTIVHLKPEKSFGQSKGRRSRSHNR